MLILVCVVLVLLIVFLGLSWWMAGYVMTGEKQTLEEAFDWQKDHYDTSFYDPLKKAEYTITGHDGYVLHALYLKNPLPSDKYMIISHGYTDNRNGDLK